VLAASNSRLLADASSSMIASSLGRRRETTRSREHQWWLGGGHPQPWGRHSRFVVSCWSVRTKRHCPGH